MAKKPKCPECGSEDLKTWAIKNNLMARCNGCKRTVTLGKPEENGDDDHKEEPAAAAPTSRAGKKRAKKRGAGKAGGLPQRTVQQPKPQSDDPIGDTIKRGLKWLIG